MIHKVVFSLELTHKLKGLELIVPQIQELLAYSIRDYQCIYSDYWDCGEFEKTWAYLIRRSIYQNLDFDEPITIDFTWELVESSMGAYVYAYQQNPEIITPEVITRENYVH